MDLQQRPVSGSSPSADGRPWLPGLLLRLLSLWLCLPCASRAAEISMPSSFLAITQFNGFARSVQIDPRETILESPVFRTASPWNELLLSWNVRASGGGSAVFEAQALNGDQSTKFYSLGAWAAQTNGLLRHSVKGQKDDDGDVLTDVLRLANPTDRFRLRVHLRPGTNGSLPELLRMGVSAVHTNEVLRAGRDANRHAWGHLIAIPETSQHAYHGGKVWCSPTSLSMVMRHWAKTLCDSTLDQDVPHVAAGVYDPSWGGTGNWPFNTAFAGSYPALSAYALRLRDLRDLEDYVVRDIPVILSVSLGRLRGRAPFRDDGHLVVLVGFNDQGDAWIHDPDSPFPPVPGKSVRRLYSRQNLEQGWAASRRTVYLIQPAANPPPSL